MCLMGSLCLMDNYDIKAHEYASNGFLMPTGVNSKHNGLILYYTSIFFMLLKCIIVYRSVIDHILLLLYLKQMHGFIPFQCHPNRSVQTRRWRCCSLTVSPTINWFVAIWLICISWDHHFSMHWFAYVNAVTVTSSTTKENLNVQSLLIIGYVELSVCWYSSSYVIIIKCVITNP